MFRFQYTQHLYAIGILPLLVLAFIGLIYWRRNRLRKLGDPRLLEAQVLGYIPGRQTTKFILFASALLVVIIGWANLQAGDKLEKVERKGVDVVIALDVSKSMLAKDIAPDRLTRAKQLIMLLAEKMQNDRVAFVIFAGKSYLQIPLTVDYSALKMMVQNVSPSMVPTQGTVIGDAIEMSMGCFSQAERKHKSLIIISDGEDHDEKAAEKVRQAAEQGIIVHTVGIGSPQGTTLYDPETRSVKLDDNGSPVISKLNEDELRSLASKGGGNYYFLQNAGDIADKLTTSLENMEQKNLGAVVYSDFTSFFQYFLIAGFLLLLIDMLIPGAKSAAKTSLSRK